MEKFYFIIEGLSMNLENSTKAEEMANQIRTILELFGCSEAEVNFCDEKYFKENIVY